MSLYQICSNICEKLEHAEKFNKLKSDKERIKFCYDICNNYLKTLNFKRTFKSTEKYRDLFERANCTFYKKNQNLEGIKLITECIANAGNKWDLFYGHKSRSDILISFQYRDEASLDFFRALNYAEHESKEEQILRNYGAVLTNPQSQPYLIGSGNVPLRKEQGGNGKYDKFLESASTSVGLTYSDFWERQLIAQNDIKTGEVLIVESPYASVLLPDHYYTHCSHCLMRCLCLLPCNKCCFTMFCDENCQSKSLESYHEIECSIMDILVELKAERMELLSLRILICAANQGKDLVKLCQSIDQWESTKSNNDSKSGQSYKSSDFVNIYNLVTNSEKRSASDLFFRCVVSAVLTHVLAKYTEFFRFVPKKSREFYEVFCVGFMFHFMQSLPCNAHEISELTYNGLDEIGAGIYATLSLINHSCDPNVVRYSCKNVIVLKAIKPIKKNEQILDNYGYHYATHSLDERQDSLKKQYYFNCECEACTQVWPKYEHLPKENVKFKKRTDVNTYRKLTKSFEINLKSAIEGNFNSQTVQQLAHYLDYLHEFVELPWQDFNNCQEAIKHCWSFNGNHFTHSKAVSL